MPQKDLQLLLRLIEGFAAAADKLGPLLKQGQAFLQRGVTFLQSGDNFLQTADILFKCLDALEEYNNNIQQTADEGTNDNETLIKQLNDILNE